MSSLKWIKVAVADRDLTEEREKERTIPGGWLPAGPPSYVCRLGRASIRRYTFAEIRLRVSGGLVSRCPGLPDDH